MTIQCCVCGKIREDEKWLHHHDRNSREAISHTYCPVCLNEAITGVNNSQRHEQNCSESIATAV